MCQVGPLVCSARSPVPDQRASFPGLAIGSPCPISQLPPRDHCTMDTEKCCLILLPTGTCDPICYWLPDPSHAHREALPRELWLLGNPPRLLRPYVIAGHSFQPADLHASPLFPGRLPSLTLALIESCTQTDPEAIFQRHQLHQV